MGAAAGFLVGGGAGEGAVVDPEGTVLASSAGALVEGSGDESLYPGGGPPYRGTGAVGRGSGGGGGPPYLAHPAITIAELSATAASLEVVRVVRQNGQVTSSARR